MIAPSHHFVDHLKQFKWFNKSLHNYTTEIRNDCGKKDNERSMVEVQHAMWHGRGGAAVPHGMQHDIEHIVGACASFSELDQMCD